MNSTLKTGYGISCFLAFIACIFTILYTTVSSEFGAFVILFWFLVFLTWAITISYNNYQNKQKRKILPI